MALQFILGGAGPGKTRMPYDRAMRESMEHPEQKYLMVVPEQFTIQTQKGIARPHPRHGTMNVGILSFKRLTHRIFEDLGARILVVLDDMGKFTVLRKVAGLKRGRLSLYKGHSERSDSISQLRFQISELSQYGIMPDMLREVRGKTGTPLLVQKLEDLEVIYNGFREYVESYYITVEKILDILCRELSRWEPLKDSITLPDGYASFTPVQHRLVGLLLMHTKDVVCTVTIDPKENAYKESSIQHPPYMNRHTVYRVVPMAKRHGIPKKKGIICDRRPAWRYDESPESDFLKQNLYRYSGRT